MKCSLIYVWNVVWFTWTVCIMIFDGRTICMQVVLFIKNNKNGRNERNRTLVSKVSGVCEWILQVILSIRPTKKCSDTIHSRSAGLIPLLIFPSLYVLINPLDFWTIVRSGYLFMALKRIVIYMEVSYQSDDWKIIRSLCVANFEREGKIGNA